MQPLAYKPPPPPERVCKRDSRDRVCHGLFVGAAFSLSRGVCVYVYHKFVCVTLSMCFLRLLASLGMQLAALYFLEGGRSLSSLCGFFSLRVDFRELTFS